MQALNVPIDNPRSAVDKVRDTLVGLSQPDQDVLRATGGLQDAAMVRHIIGLDPVRHGVAVAHAVSEGMQLVFCKRDATSAKADLLRMATESRKTPMPNGRRPPSKRLWCQIPVGGSQAPSTSVAPAEADRISARPTQNCK